jgi:hypothetical protein
MLVTSSLAAAMLAACLAVAVGAAMSVWAAERGDAAAQSGLMVFDIPAQPLAFALEAYGAVTGIEVFYDAELATGRRSAGVKGTFSPARGLEALLHGTGYVARTTGSGAVSIVLASAAAAQQVTASRRVFNRYDRYFAALQARLGQALCGSDHAQVGSGEIIFKFWLAGSGVIARADIVASGGDPAIANGIAGLDIGEPLPAGLPQPVTMAVLPPVQGEATGCPAGHGSDAGH